MARYGRLLTDAQLEKIRPLLPKRPKRRWGRPPSGDRNVLAATSRLGRAGSLAHYLARIPGGTETNASD